MNQCLVEFIKNVRWELTKSGKSFGWLAEQSGISQCMISYYLTGKSQPSLKNALLIAAALEVPLSTLLGEKTENLSAMKHIFLQECSSDDLLEEVDRRLKQNKSEDES